MALPDRPGRAVIVPFAILGAALATFTACSFAVRHVLGPDFSSTSSHGLVTRIVIAASELWHRYAVFISIFLVMVTATVASVVEKWRGWSRDRAARRSAAVRISAGTVSSHRTAGQTGEPKQYRLRITVTTAVLNYGLPAFFVLVTIGLLVVRPEGMTKSPYVIAAWIAAGTWLAWTTLRLPTLILFSPDGMIEFAGLIGRRRIPADSVISIRPGGNREGMLVLNHQHGKIYLLSQFDGFHDFLTELKRLNPLVELQGC